MRIATEDLVRSFSRKDDLVARIANRAAQEILGHPVGIEAKRLRLQDRIRKMIRQIVLPDGNGMELGADLGRHLPGLCFLVVLGPVEGQSEGSDGVRAVPSGKSEHRAGIEPATEIASDGNVGAQANADGLLQSLAKLRGVVGVGPSPLLSVRQAVVKIPIPV